LISRVSGIIEAPGLLKAQGEAKRKSEEVCISPGAPRSIFPGSSTNIKITMKDEFKHNFRISQ
jgi:hypothetical protein